MKEGNTPKTLHEACLNAILEAIPSLPASERAIIMRQVIRDYLAQKFQMTMLETDHPKEINKLWNRITGENL